MGDQDYIVLLLTTNTPPDLGTENGQRKVVSWFDSKKVQYRQVDAVDDADVRKELTKISERRGNYPQVFITDQASETVFIGGFDEIQDLIEMNDLDAAILEANPDLKTFDQVFAKCIKK
mmetsp:Transcript_22948/g.40649  ORF Transcript_22948/g.40649 Transcript_22948/m.40649 type:complete len:119 (-) Transcript_22948:109-465(-)